MRLLSGLFTAALTVALLGVAPSANARELTHHDGVGDVWQYWYHDDYAPEPDRVVGDVTSVTIRHKRHLVQLFMSLRDIDPTARYSFFYFQLQNGRHQITDVSVNSYPNLRSGALDIHRVNGPRTCAGHRAFKINWETNVVAATIPRSCVGSPKYIRLRAGSDIIDSGNESDHTDSAFSTKDWFNDAIYHPGAWSRWVKRG